MSFESYVQKKLKFLFQKVKDRNYYYKYYYVLLLLYIINKMLNMINVMHFVLC